MNSSRFCTHCGFSLEPDVRFCRNCGQPVYQVPSGPPIQMSQPASPPYPPAAPARRQAPKKSILLPVALILVGLCGLVVLIGAAAGGYYTLQQAPVAGRLTPVARSASTQTVEGVLSIQSTAQPSPTATATPSPTETFTPQPTQPEATPTLPPPTATETETVFTGEQSLDDYYMFDDFSSNAFGWMEMSNEEVWAGLESDAYTLHIRAAEQGAPAFLPVSFFPQAVEFDAIVPPDYVDGAFGVSCNYQDEDNFTFVSFATETSQYSIGQVVGGQLTTLTNPEWQSSTNMDTSPPWSNHILVDCGGSMIAVFINNEWETEVALDSASQPGEMAVFAQSWENSSGRGYKVYFDNLSAWKPVQ